MALARVALAVLSAEHLTKHKLYVSLDSEDSNHLQLPALLLGFTTASRQVCGLPKHQVTTDCRPQQLIEYLCGEAAKAASTAAVAQDTARNEEARLLEAARLALGAKHIIKVCSAEEHPSVSQPLKRLIQGAPAIRQVVDLSGGHCADLVAIFCFLSLFWLSLRCPCRNPWLNQQVRKTWYLQVASPVPALTPSSIRSSVASCTGNQLCCLVLETQPLLKSEDMSEEVRY